MPRACLRAFSCLTWTARKCWRSSCHLMSSLPSLERVDERLPTALHTESELSTTFTVVGVEYARFGRDVEEACRVDSIQAVAEGEECGTLGQQHQEPI